MGKPITPATRQDREKVDEAVVLLRRARDLLREAGAKRAAEKCRLAIASAGGAQRHVLHRELRTEI